MRAFPRLWRSHQSGTTLRVVNLTTRSVVPLWCGYAAQREPSRRLWLSLRRAAASASNGSLLTIAIIMAEKRSLPFFMAHDVVDRAGVVILQAAAEGIGQHFLGQTAAKQVGFSRAALCEARPGR